MGKAYIHSMLDEWAARTPGVTKVPLGEGALDTPEKIEAYHVRMEEAYKNHRKPGLLPRCPWRGLPRRSL